MRQSVMRGQRRLLVLVLVVLVVLARWVDLLSLVLELVLMLVRWRHKRRLI